jgi:hypothetical protein
VAGSLVGLAAQQNGRLPDSSDFAKQFPVEKRDGHMAPVLVTVTPLIGKSREVMLLGVADYERPASIYTHQINARSEDNSSEVALWFDTIAVIKEITSDDFVVVLKSGAAQRVRWSGANCHGEPNSAWKCSFAAVANPDGTREVINLTRIRSVEFR